MNNKKKVSLLTLVLVIIIVVLVMLLAFSAYLISTKSTKNLPVTNEQEKTVINNKVSAIESREINEYIANIYSCLERTIPSFDTVANLNKGYLTSLCTLKFFDSNNNIPYNSVLTKAQELFGKQVSTLETSNDNLYFVQYLANTQEYNIIPRGGGVLSNKFVIKNINKENNNFTIEIVEYVVNIGEEYNTNSSIYDIKVTDVNQNIITTVKSNMENTIESFVKENTNKFTSRIMKIVKDETTGKYIVLSFGSK